MILEVLMQIPPELKTVLKRLKLSGMLATLPDRGAYARQEKLTTRSSWNWSSPTKSSAAITNASPIGYARPASRKNAPWNVSIGRPKSASTKRA
jgi:hypothetical protein